MIKRRDVVGDALGLVLVAALIGWLQWSAAVTGSDASGHTALLLASAGGLALGRLVGLASRWLAPAGLVAFGGWIAWRDWDVLLGGPLSSPLGYANATGAFYLLVTAAALIVAARVGRWWLAVPAVAAAVAAAAVPWANGTKTAAVMTVLLPLGFIGAWGRRAATVVGLAAAGLAALVFAATVWLGAAYDPADRTAAADRLVDATLTERRPMLWADALAQLAAEPATGVGPSRFAEFSPTARADPDASWAHQEWLQLGAESGWPGLVLGVGLLAWGFWRLARSPRDAGTALAAVVLAGITVQASLDYVLHFPEVVVAVGLVVGAGASPAVWRRETSATRPARRSATSR